MGGPPPMFDPIVIPMGPHRPAASWAGGVIPGRDHLAMRNCPLQWASFPGAGVDDVRLLDRCPRSLLSSATRGRACRGNRPD